MSLSLQWSSCVLAAAKMTGCWGGCDGAGRLLRTVVWALRGPRWLPLWVQVVGLHGDVAGELRLPRRGLCVEQAGRFEEAVQGRWAVTSA